MRENLIVFRLLPERGHHNATFYFSKTLQACGYRIVYATVQRMRPYIESNGFEFYWIPTEEDPAGSTNITYSGWFRSNVIKLKKIVDLRQKMKWAAFFITNHNYLIKLKRDLHPDLIIVDRCYGQMVLNAIELSIPVFQAETTVSCNKVKGLPPFTSYYLPRFNAWSSWICEILWARIFIAKKIEAFLYGDFNTIIIALAKKANYPVNQINFKRDHNPGFNTVPELIFSPQEFDFPHQPAENQRYVGPSLFTGRNDGVSTNDFSNPFKGSAHPLIYCALGALSHRYPGIDKFFKRLIEVFRIRTSYNLIVCISNDALRHELMAHQLTNVAFFKYVPQPELLTDVDVMINHGGMNSITECILAGVPMLIYPGTHHLDQNGNSARAIYHNLGLRGKLTKDKTKTMMIKIDRLVSQEFFKQNVFIMQQKIQRNENFNSGVAAVHAVLQREPVSYY